MVRNLGQQPSPGKQHKDTLYEVKYKTYEVLVDSVGKKKWERWKFHKISQYLFVCHTKWQGKG